MNRFTKMPIIVSYFFVNKEVAVITVNGDTYYTMTTDIFITVLHGIDVNNIWFQQDCATCHTSHAAIDLLRQMFDDRLIRRNVDVNGPTRSCDLKPLDYFL